MAADMNIDMDIDMDIDLAPDPDVAALEVEADTQPIENGTTEYIPEAYSMEGDSVPEKVHVRGLDTLATADVKAFLEEHSAMDQFERVEWIDDTSANIIYKSSEAASLALLALSLPQNFDLSSMDPLQLRPGKKLSSHPDTELQIRRSLSTDVKKPRAYEASRFYLMNPDKDPREMRRQRGERRGGGRNADRYEDYQRRKRRQDDRDSGFNESMYDDNAGVTNRASPTSFSESGDDRRRKRTRVDSRKTGDLFSSKMRSGGRLRDRSASPGRDGDGRYGFSEDDSSRLRARRRSASPPSQIRGTDLLPKKTIELFPGKASKSHAPGGSGELFPDKTPPSKKPKELFPKKTPHSNHRRTDAFDAADETSPGPFSNGRRESPRDLFDRIGRSASSYGRISGSANSQPTVLDNNGSKDDFSVLGKGNETGPGFSIRGAAQSSEQPSSAKELFPNKISGNDLFAEKLKGRGGPRKRAQDLFG